MTPTPIITALVHNLPSSGRTRAAASCPKLGFPGVRSGFYGGSTPVGSGKGRKISKNVVSGQVPASARPCGFDLTKEGSCASTSPHMPVIITGTPGQGVTELQ